MNDPKFLRTGTLFQAFHEAGAKIAIVTAKDKLRRLLGHGLDYTSEEQSASPRKKRMRRRLLRMVSRTLRV